MVKSRMLIQRRRQKNFQDGERGATENRPKNSTIKPLSTVSVQCMKIQGGDGPPAPRCQRPWIYSTFRLMLATVKQIFAVKFDV